MRPPRARREVERSSRLAPTSLPLRLPASQ